MRIPGFTTTACAALLLLCLRAAPVLAAAPDVLLADLTWTELRDQIRAGKTTIIIPVGGTEQSGPYVALGKHNARVLALSQQIAQGLGNAIVAPVIAYVPEGGLHPPSSHMRFPGTITIPDSAFEAMLGSAAESFRVHGFRNIVFLGDHGGYQRDLRQVAARLNKQWGGTGARALVPAAYYQASSQGFDELLRKRGYRDDEIGTHAGLADTALQLAVAPGMVRAQRLKTAPRPGTADGIYGGDPRRASAQLGELGVRLIVERTVAALRKETARP
ncbi:creatininase family protein [Candidimonas nitroreducens]|uniref:Creatininase n=1 Tax=Candidimonas nitroreducens TaxID=683354 RepID=A0A225M6L7_9BURK|nr:creatininase family protein [Candidimonas nitroreducens]OWT55201.1 creatininase [Candidimonas nitroreducens]